jgi:hypothetical protein
MKKLFAFVVLICSITACNNKSNSNGNSSDDPGSLQTQKKIQPGDSLIFNCLDSIDKSGLNLTAIWDANKSNWNVSLIEKDKFGNQVISLKDLVGAPDDVEELHMNITHGDVLYAIIFQIGKNEAQYRDGSKIWNCTFQ